MPRQQPGIQNEPVPLDVMATLAPDKASIRFLLSKNRWAALALGIALMAGVTPLNPSLQARTDVVTIYVNDIPLAQWDPGAFLETEARPGGPWNFTPDEIWSKQVALAKLSEMRERVMRSLDRLDDAALLEPETVHPWTGGTRLGKMIYELRHIQHHLGAISAELKRQNVRPFERWD